MSREQAERFWDRIGEDGALQGRIRRGYRRLLCDLAEQEGFSVTEEDLRREFLRRRDGLSDEELDRVSGGNEEFPEFPRKRGPVNTDFYGEIG